MSGLQDAGLFPHINDDARSKSHQKRNVLFDPVTKKMINVVSFEEI